MDEKALKTTTKQRIIIILVAILLLGSTILTYMFIVMSGSGQRSSAERISELEDEYTAKQAEIDELAKTVGEKHFSDLKGYMKQVKSYNAATANSEKLKIEDLKVGTGRELGEGDSDYMAYYIGWCPDGSLLDSSFTYAEDDTDKTTPIALKTPLIAPSSLIEGWTQGVVGMKLGGVRQISMPGEMAYGDTAGDKYCGMTNAPLKYVVMALDIDDTLRQPTEDLKDIWMRLLTAYYAGQE